MAAKNAGLPTKEKPKITDQEYNPFEDGAPEPNLPNSPVGLPGAAVGADETYDYDFDGVSTGFPFISAGRRLFRITDFSKGPNKQGDGERFEVVMVCQTPGADRGREQKTWLSLKPNARWKYLEFLEALKLVSGGSVGKFSRSQVIGQLVACDVSNEDYTDQRDRKQTRSNIDAFYTPTDEEKKSVSAGAAP